MDTNISITPYVLDEFLSITGSDIRAFLINYSIFYQSDYIVISDFYQGKSKEIEPDVFENFKRLKSQLKDIIQKFQQFNMQLENIKFVELLDTIEQCNDTLQTLNNINKWARCTSDLFGYNPTLKVEYVLSQFDSLETIASNVLSSNNPQNDWYNIAIENNLSENDYTSEGGKILNITMNNNDIQNFSITSVVDIIKGKSVYGRDINQYLHFDIDNEDISCLNEDDTIIQAVNILVTLRRRDNLDFLNNGLQTSLIIGQTKSLFNFPVVERQMQNTFNSDDTLKNFTLKQFYFDQDNVFIDFTVETRLGEVMELSQNLSQ